RQCRSDARLLDVLGEHRVHDAPRRVHELLRPGRRRVRLHLSPELGNVRRPVLAAGLRRHPRGHRHLRAGWAPGARELTTRAGRAAHMILVAEGLRKLYGEFCALDGVSLGVAAREFVSIIGPNGAGKSTLINILTGLTPPTA